MTDRCNLDALTPKTVNSEKLGSGRFGEVFKVNVTEIQKKKNAKSTVQIPPSWHSKKQQKLALGFSHNLWS